MKLLAYDTETTGLNPWKGDRPFIFAFCDEQGRTEVHESPVDPSTRRPMHTDFTRKRVRAILTDRKIAKVGHNLKYDMRMAESEEIVSASEIIAMGFRGEIHETMFMAHLCKSDELNFKLKPLAKKYLNFPDDDEKELLDAVRKCRRWGRKWGWWIHEEVGGDYWLPAAVAAYDPEVADSIHPNLANLARIYAAKDVERTMLLHGMYSLLLEEYGLNLVYQRERKLWPIVYQMESRGIYVDCAVAEAEVDGCLERMRVLRRDLTKVFGPFEKTVPDQRLRDYLFSPVRMGGLGLKPDPKKKTEKQKLPQVTRDVLEAFIYAAPILSKLIDFDKNLKAVGTYFENYLRMVILESGMAILHASFTQIGPRTGRFASRDPNLQNVPKRAIEGDVMKRVRRPFGPRPGYVWLHLDYKAIEARIFAENADETDMLAVFASGKDIYDDLVDRVKRISGLDVTRLYAFADGSKPGSGARQICKNNFLGWTYGEGVEKMARSMSLKTEVALQVIKALRMAYSKARPYMKRTQVKARIAGHIVNRFGRRVPIPPVFWDNKTKEWIDLSYKAINYTIQSEAADMMKEAMIRCAAYIKTLNRRVHMVMTIHDELVFEIHRQDFTASLVRKLASIMSGVADGVYHKVKFPVDANVTRSRWDTPDKLSLRMAA